MDIKEILTDLLEKAQEAIDYYEAYNSYESLLDFTYETKEELEIMIKDSSIN